MLGRALSFATKTKARRKASGGRAWRQKERQKQRSRATHQSKTNERKAQRENPALSERTQRRKERRRRGEIAGVSISPLHPLHSYFPPLLRVTLSPACFRCLYARRRGKGEPVEQASKQSQLCPETDLERVHSKARDKRNLQQAGRRAGQLCREREKKRSPHSWRLFFSGLHGRGGTRAGVFVTLSEATSTTRTRCDRTLSALNNIFTNKVNEQPNEAGPKIRRWRRYKRGARCGGEGVAPAGLPRSSPNGPN